MRVSHRQLHCFFYLAVSDSVPRLVACELFVDRFVLIRALSQCTQIILMSCLRMCCSVLQVNPFIVSQCEIGTRWAVEVHLVCAHNTSQ